MSKLLRGWPVALLLALPSPAQALGFGDTINLGGCKFLPWPYEAHWRMPAPCAPWNTIPMTLPPNFRMYPNNCGPGGCAPGMPGMGMPGMGRPMPAMAAPPARPGSDAPPAPAPSQDKPADPRSTAQPVGYSHPAPYYPPAAYFPPSGYYPTAVPWSYYQAPSWYYGR